MDFGKCSKSAQEDCSCCPLFSSLCFPLSSALSLHPLNDFGKGLWSSKAWFFMNLSFQCFAMDSKELSSISYCFGDQKAIKTPKLNTIWLALIARVLNMPIELKGNNYYSKVFKRVNYKLSNSTFWVVITPPNRHIASPLAMKERKIKINITIIYNIMLIKKRFSSGMMI